MNNNKECDLLLQKDKFDTIQKNMLITVHKQITNMKEHLKQPNDSEEIYILRKYIQKMSKFRYYFFIIYYRGT